MNIENKKIYIFLFFLWMILKSISLLEFYDILGKIAAILLLIVNGLLIYRAYSSRNIILIIGFVFMGMYAAVPYYVFHLHLYPSSRAADCSASHFFEATMILLLFQIFLAYFCNFQRQVKIPSIKIGTDRIVWSVSAFIAFLLMLFGKRGQTILEGGYGAIETQNSNLNEYFIIFILLMYLYSSEVRFQKIVFYGLIFSYIIKNLLYGGRIETIEVGILLIYCVTRYKFSLRVHMLLMVAAFCLIGLFGLLRSNIDFILTGHIDWEKILSFENREYLESNEGDVFYASSRMFFLMENGYLDVIDRINAFFSFTGLIFVPSSIVPDIGVLASYKTNIYNSGGGGLAPIYYFVFLGYLGVILLAFFCGKIFSSISCPKNKYLSFYSILFISMIPRWFAYYPIHLTKFCAYGLLLFCVIEFLRNKCFYENTACYKHIGTGRC